MSHPIWTEMVHENVTKGHVWWRDPKVSILILVYIDRKAVNTSTGYALTKDPFNHAEMFFNEKGPTEFVQYIVASSMTFLTMYIAYYKAAQWTFP